MSRYVVMVKVDAKDPEDALDQAILTLGDYEDDSVVVALDQLEPLRKKASK